jgi:hypothetical protein
MLPLLTETVGVVSTVTEPVLLAVRGHPLRLPLTVYTVLVAGLTTMLLLLAPELQV